MANGRCKLHGGKVNPSQARLWRPGMAAMRLGWKAWIEARWALGLKHPGGRPSRVYWRLKGNERERLVRDMKELVEAFPLPSVRPREEWSHSEILMEAARLGGLRVIEILEQPVDRDDVKWANLTATTGLGAMKILANVQEASMRQATDKGWDEILARIAQERQKSSRKPASEKKSIKTVDSDPA
jgi:hypothetical protein